MGKSVTDWQKMSKEERAIETKRQLQAAILRIEGEKYPTHVSVKVGDHSLACRPVRDTEKGVSYYVGAKFIDVGGWRLRINKVSLSVLGRVGEVDDTLADDYDIQGGEAI